MAICKSCKNQFDTLYFKGGIEVAIEYGRTGLCEECQNNKKKEDKKLNKF